MRLPVTPSGNRNLGLCAGQSSLTGAEASVCGPARVVHARNPARVPLMNEAVGLHREHMKVSAELARQLGI